jgi:hypothetical protein
MRVERLRIKHMRSHTAYADFDAAIHMRLNLSYFE